MPAWRLSCQPTRALPVKVSTWIRRSSVSGAASATSQGITLKAPAGTPASSAISASTRLESGVSSAGLRTRGHPAASAGATLWATRFKGKLKGVIAATGPLGKRRVIPIRPSPLGTASMGITSPPSDRAASTPRVKVWIARATSPSAKRRGLPPSWMMRSTSVSRRARIPSTIPSSQAARRCAGVRASSSATWTAASMARSTDSGPASCTVPTTEPSQG